MGAIKMWECKEYERNRSKRMQIMREGKKERKRGRKRERESMTDVWSYVAFERKVIGSLRGWVNKLGASLKLKRNIENMLTDIARLAEDMKSSMAKLEAVVSTKAGNEEDGNVK